METLFRRGACHRPSRCTEMQGPTRHGDPLVLYAAGASVCGAANQRPTRHGDVLPVRLKVKLVMVATKQRPTRHRNAVATTKTHPAFSGNEPEADKAWNPRYPPDRACSSCFDMAGDGAGFRASEAARSTGRVRSCEGGRCFEGVPAASKVVARRGRQLHRSAAAGPVAPILLPPGGASAPRSGSEQARVRFEERIADWQRRLVALADRPEYAYSGMTESEITWHYETLTSFKGFAEADVAAAERRLDIHFPRAFRDFLLAMGAASGQLLCGGFSDGLEELAELRDATEELIRDSESGFELPARAVVFLMRQGFPVAHCRPLTPADGGEGT